MNCGISEGNLSRIVATLAREKRVARVILFGSRAKGNYREGSDIDLCLEAPDLDFAGQSRLESELDELLLPWKIDVLISHRIGNPELLAHVERVGKTLFQRTKTDAIATIP